MAFENYSRKRKESEDQFLNNLSSGVKAEGGASHQRHARSSDKPSRPIVDVGIANERARTIPSESPGLAPVEVPKAILPKRSARGITNSESGVSPAQSFDRKKYMREYMKEHRKKPKKCPHCGEQL